MVAWSLFTHICNVQKVMACPICHLMIQEGAKECLLSSHYEPQLTIIQQRVQPRVSSHLASLVQLKG